MPKFLDNVEVYLPNTTTPVTLTNTQLYVPIYVFGESNYVIWFMDMVATNDMARTVNTRYSTAVEYMQMLYDTNIGQNNPKSILGIFKHPDGTLHPITAVWQRTNRSLYFGYYQEDGTLKTYHQTTPKTSTVFWYVQSPITSLSI